MTWKDIPRNPSATTLRQFAGLWLIFFGAIGYWRYTHGALSLGLALMVLAIAGGLAGLLAPKSLRPIFVGWMIAVFPIGWLVSHVLLAVVFYGVFTPLATVFRLMGRDALRRQPTTTATYWFAKPAAADVAGYYRQF
jgi:hypothetical protein